MGRKGKKKEGRKEKKEKEKRKQEEKERVKEEDRKGHLGRHPGVESLLPRKEDDLLCQMQLGAHT